MSATAVRARGRSGRRSARVLLALAALCAGAAGLASTSVGQARGDRGADGQDRAGPAGVALLAEVEGALGPAAEERIAQAVEEAAERGARLLVLRLDTPGGLVTSTRAAVEVVLGAPLPVVVYVAPPGARAASGGTYLLYAAHIAAMAPGTHLGAATPVPLVGDGADAAPEEAGGAANAKALEDAAASIRSLAQLRGRDPEWAERAVREAATLTAQEALARGVVDVLAADVPQLLERLDGAQVTVRAREVRLETSGLTVARWEPGWRVQLLEVLTDPNVALVLLLLGVFGLVAEVASPGLGGPGILGAICLVLGLYALNLLSVDAAGLGLLLLGLGLMVGEALVPSFGALGLGGLAAFVAGAVLMFDQQPFLRVAWPVIGGAALASAALLIVALRLVLRARRAPATTGAEGLLRARGEVLEWSDGRGQVRVQGERWLGAGPAQLLPGQAVEVRAVRGLTLEVVPIAAHDLQPALARPAGPSAERSS